MRINIEATKDEKQALLTVITDDEDMSIKPTIDEIIQAFSEKNAIKKISENILKKMAINKKLKYRYFTIEAIGLIFKVKM